jgi:hypothetical protein
MFQSKLFHGITQILMPTYTQFSKLIQDMKEISTWIKNILVNNSRRKFKSIVKSMHANSRTLKLSS